MLKTFAKIRGYASVSGIIPVSICTIAIPDEATARIKASVLGRGNRWVSSTM